MSYSSILFKSDLYIFRIPYNEFLESKTNKEEPVYYYTALYQLKYPMEKLPDEKFRDDVFDFLVWENEFEFYGLYVFKSLESNRIVHIKDYLTNLENVEDHQMILKGNYRFELSEMKTYPSWAIFYLRLHNELLSSF